MPETYVGQTLAGKYLVEGTLGDGGMGTVVVARHIELDEHVAIKLLRPELAQQEQVVGRFLREGKIAARIRSSEHIVRVRDIGRLESGVPFMVMELLQGEDLEQRLARDHRLPLDLAVGLTLQACDALAAAHDAGIVHRDIKPGNMFLTVRRNGAPSVKVLDFGISKLQGDLQQHGARTSAQEIFGSPFYMSPEQLLSSADVDARADVWSLGVVLYEMITGTVPFEADVLAKLHLAVLQGEPIDVRTHGIEVPDGLAAVIHGCLRRNLDARFQNMRDLAEALAPFAGEVGLQALDEIRNAPTTRPMSPSMSSEWAAYTDGGSGRSLPPPVLHTVPPPRASQRSIPTIISEPRIPLSPVSNKTLTPWTQTDKDEKLARRKRVGIASALAALVATLGGLLFLVRSAPNSHEPAHPNAEQPRPTGAAGPVVPPEPPMQSFEIIEAAPVDAGGPSKAGALKLGAKKNVAPVASAPEAAKPTPVPAVQKMPDDRN